MKAPTKNDNFQDYIDKYNEHARKVNLSESTIELRKSKLKYFVDYLRMYQPKIKDLRDVTRSVAEEFIDYIDSFETRYHRKFAEPTRHMITSGIRYFFNFLVKKNLLLVNPMSGVAIKPIGKQLPKRFLSENEIHKYLNTPDITTLTGLRDRAILELFYGSGIRLSELTTLKFGNLDLERGFITITGKGMKDRVVPITGKSKFYIKRYLKKVRPVYLIRNVKEETVFLNRFGNTLNKAGLNFITNWYARKAGLTFKVSPHMLRHTCATHLIFRGANIRYVQELLGHNEISTTQIYTHLVPVQLQKIYELTHPRCIKSDPAKEEEE